MKLSSIISVVIVIAIIYILICCTWNITQAQISHPCMHLSERLEDSLESIGIPVSLGVCWNVENDTITAGHMYIVIVGVPIDSTSLLPVVNTYYRYDDIHESFTDMEDYYEAYPSHRG